MSLTFTDRAKSLTVTQCFAIVGST
ncbi:hypothetical protein EVA_10602, partial [gut metagenome]